MKKIISTMLCTTLLLCLPACKDTDDPIPSTAIAAPSATTEGALPNETVPHVDLPAVPVAAVSLTPTTEAEILPDGTVLFEYNYPTINLSLPDGEMAESVMLDFLNRIDATRPEAQQVKEAAEEYYTGKVGWNTYFYNLTYSPMRIDTGILSLYGMESSYSGGMHPNHNACAVNYDLTTGKAMKLRHILTEKVTADSLTKLVCNALEQQAENLFSDYALSVEDRFAGDFGADDLWYLSDTGLCFFFSPYEIAPYNAGTVIAEIPYENLTGLLLDDYFPGETVATNGSVHVESLKDTSILDKYSGYAEITLATDGDTAVITTNNALVYHVKIELGEWNADGTIFEPRSTVFATNAMNPLDAIILKANFSDELPNIRIQFSSEAGSQAYFLSYRNGNATLSVPSNEQ